MNQQLSQSSASEFPEDARRTRALAWLAQASAGHIRRFWWVWAAAIASLATFNHFCALAINGWTDSLPQKTFLILKQSRSFQRGDYVSFKWHGGGPYPKELPFTKIIKGVPGDVVTVQGREFLINGVPVATAKEFSKKGQPLQLGPTGVIPPGHYFVWTPHKDSLDSRYALTGWIKDAQVMGKAIPLQ